MTRDPSSPPWGWISVEEAVETVRDRPAHVNVVGTGRDAPAALR